MTYRDKKASLLAVLESYAPDSSAIDLCHKQIRAAETDGCDESFIIMHLVNTLADGVNYGNWPWVRQASLNEQKKGL